MFGRHKNVDCHSRQVQNIHFLSRENFIENIGRDRAAHSPRSRPGIALQAGKALYARPGFFLRISTVVRTPANARTGGHCPEPPLSVPKTSAALSQPHLEHAPAAGSPPAALPVCCNSIFSGHEAGNLCDPGQLLARLPLEKVGNFGLQLNCSRQEKEGDLVIGLVNLDTGVALFTLAFSITRFETGPKEILIGGLQGNKRANDKDLVISLTRGLHGLRPKALLLFVLQQLAAIWGISRLRAVSDDLHIYRHWQKRKHVAASYDEWWIESGGHRAGDGMFDLPVTFVPRETSTLKVNKRQMYRRRYIMLAEIADQIRHAHATHVPAAVTKRLKTEAIMDVNLAQDTRRAHSRGANISGGNCGVPISDPASFRTN